MENLRTTEEAGDYLHISPCTLASWRCKGQGPAYIKVGGAVRYRMQDLLIYEARQLVDGLDEKSKKKLWEEMKDYKVEINK